ncbi:dihydrodipicolinate synthase family protein [Phenylobacterium sp. SCN 70-31]|uniref:dihydrodipicolinate synthase family protein n=1 Tax=Phenylobacterium sp. SCN 70-31 TaxID=1660129 RepID=UPI00086F423D|nr:dihydrodipicolinate synthase family protein [Phenylobacterium sp. SCN 70-31]ODT89638.1 MAG: hypothetical protein ABS78_02120 [Phenylobacterium sp. SCN 70-31]
MSMAPVSSRRALLKGAGSLAVAALAPSVAVSAPVPASARTGPFGGVFPIGFTTDLPNGRLDYDGLASQVRFCGRGGVPGFAWPQLASGWTTLSEPERLKGAEVMVDAARQGGPAIVVGVQSREADFAETERYARHAEKIGADAVICIPPPNVSSPKDLLQYYRRIGQVTKLPMFGQAVGPFSVDLLVEMYETIPTFRYVKDETGDPLERVLEINRRTGGGLRSFSGFGVATMMTEMERGFGGHCPFVSLSDLFATTYDLFHSGRRREAFDLFGRIQAASSIFGQSDINVLVARGVLKPEVTKRVAPDAPGSGARKPPVVNPDEIRRVLDVYLQPYLRA